MRHADVLIMHAQQTDHLLNLSPELELAIFTILGHWTTIFMAKNKQRDVRFPSEQQNLCD